MSNTLAFHSILFEGDGHAEDPQAGHGIGAAALSDLNLDQVVAAALRGTDDPGLRALFERSAPDVATVRYRQRTCADLDDPALREGLTRFRDRMASVTRLAEPRTTAHRYQRLRWLIDAAEAYGEALRELAATLDSIHLRSPGMVAFRGYLAAYSSSAALGRLLADAGHAKASLETVRYNLAVDGLRVRVLPFRDEPDYGSEIEATFARFVQGEVESHEFRFPGAYMTRVDAEIVERVGRLFPDVFGELERFGERHDRFVDPTIARFGREIGFFLAYLALIAPLRSRGLPFCYPEVADGGDVAASRAFDLALAIKLVDAGRVPVLNDFELAGTERVLVVTGPNQGGKTTFARMFGQIHHLASLGLPVPGSAARLRLFDRLFTHFDRRERLEDLTGKLEDDLLRLHAIVENATDRSIAILNESLSSTTIQDSLFISERVLGELIRRDALCVFVTFLDELSRLGPATVSMVATVDPSDPTIRTHRVVRRPADGLAHALALSGRYSLGYADLRARMAR
jgi:DNA mismatch repair protein MutS